MRTLLLLLITLASFTAKKMTIESFAFEHNGRIPDKYTCDGKNISPELTIKGIPKEARSLVLIIDDPDATNGTFDHWVMWNIPVQNKIGEDSAPGVQGKNGKGENKYTGPCPPKGVHHYHFKLYALDMMLDLPEGSDKKTVMKAMEGHLLERAELIGLFER